MLRKPLELVPATVRDLAVLAPIHRRAFAPMPVTRYLCTSVDPAVLEESYQCHRAKVIEDAQGQYRGNSVMTVARQGDQVLGFVWSVRQPAAKDWPPVTSTQQEYPIPAGYVPVRKRDFDAMLMRHARVSLSCVGVRHAGILSLSHRGQELAQLTLFNAALLTVSVDPAAQGAGVGKRLVHSVIKQAASEGLPVVLEAEEGKPSMQRKDAGYVYTDPKLQKESRCTCRQALNFSGTAWLRRKTVRSGWVETPAFGCTLVEGLTNHSALVMANGAQDAESVDRLGVGADLKFCDTRWKKDDRKYGQMVIAGNLCTHSLTRRCCNFHRKRVKRAEPCGAPPSRLGRATKHTRWLTPLSC